MDSSAPIPLIAMWLLIAPVVIAAISAANAKKTQRHRSHDDVPLRTDPVRHEASPAAARPMATR